MNYAILQGWIEANPVLAKLALVPERRDPILLPTDRDIALVMERAPGMVGQMMRAALVTGAREDELAKAKRIDIDHARRQLTVIGKRNKLRVIDLTPFDGYEFFTALPAYVGKPFLFWHDEGERYASFAPTFHKLMNRTEAWAKANGSSSAASRSTICATGTRSTGSNRAATSTRCKGGLGTPASRPPRCISNI